MHWHLEPRRRQTHVDRRRRRFRHPQRARVHRGQRSGRLGSGMAEYPLHRKREDPDHATQSHADHMRALAEATQKALAAAGVRGEAVEAIALDTTGSSVIPVGADLEPLDDYYLWCDHRAWSEAGADHRDGAQHEARSHRLVRRHVFLRVGLLEAAALAAPQSGEARPLCHRARALRHGGGHAVRRHAIRRRRRAACAPWATSGCGTRRWAGCRRRSSWSRWIRCSPGVRAKTRRACTPPATASPGSCRPNGRRSSGCAPGIPIPVGRLRRALGRDRRGRAALATWSTWSAPRPASWPSRPGRRLMPGVCGVVQGSIHPGMHRHRSGTFGHRRYLRRHRAARRHHRSRARRRLDRRTRGRPDGAAAPDLGQRRPHRAGEPGAGRRHARLEPDAHRAGRTVRGHRGHGVPHAHHSGADGGARRPD